jgi:hypothetical protein
MDIPSFTGYFTLVKATKRLGVPIALFDETYFNAYWFLVKNGYFLFKNKIELPQKLSQSQY